MGQRPRRTSFRLPAAPHVPGRTPDPREDALWSEVPQSDRFDWACDLFEAGLFWEAHEVWEERWSTLPEGSAAARHQQGLLLVAAALHKHALGEGAGAEQLLGQARRVLQQLTTRRGQVVAGLDVPGLLGGAEVALRGGDPPVLGDVRPLRVEGPALAVAGPDAAAPPAWPLWVEEWVLPYLREPALWPVLLALLGHVVVVIAPLCLAVARTGSGWALLGLLMLAAGSAWLCRWELSVRGRPGSVAATVGLTWLVSLVSAWGADRLGVL